MRGEPVADDALVSAVAALQEDGEVVAVAAGDEVLLERIIAVMDDLAEAGIAPVSLSR